MTFKKSWYSYGLWAFYVIFAFAFQVGTVFVMTDYSPSMNEYVKIGVVCLSFAVVTGLFFLIRKLIGERWKDTTEGGIKRAKLVEAVIFVMVFAAGIVLRIMFLENVGDEAVYFALASVDGQPLPGVNHGAQQIYLGLLRGLFLVLGNRYMAGILLQMILQILMALVWYFAVRKMAGQTASFILFAGVMLLPQSIHMGLVYSPKILYLLLFGIVLLLMSGFWNRFCRQTELKWYSWVQTVLLGIGMGCMIYLDITGMVLVLLLLFALAVQSSPVEEPYTQLQKLLQVLLALLVCVATIIGMFLLETLIKGGTLITASDRWFDLFVCKGLPGLDGLKGMISIDLPNSITAIAAAVILSMAALAFWMHKKKEMQMPWFAVTIVLAILYTCNFCDAGMQCDYMLVLMVLLLAGVGVRAIFMEKDNERVVAKQEEKTMEKTMEKSMENPVENPVQERKINYIENPLPLPKKHTKRTMGYGVEVPPEAMKFDVEVSENDDFDIK